MMGLTKLPNGKGAIYTHQVDTVIKDMVDGQIVVIITWKDQKKKDLIIPCKSEEEATEIVDFIVEKTNIVAAPVLIPRKKSRFEGF